VCICDTKLEGFKQRKWSTSWGGGSWQGGSRVDKGYACIEEKNKVVIDIFIFLIYCKELF
jgi:hypothetical protein